MKAALRSIGARLRSEILAVAGATMAIRVRLLVTLLAGAVVTGLTALWLDPAWTRVGEAPFGEWARPYGGEISHYAKPHLLPLGLALLILIAGYALKRVHWRRAAVAATLAMLLVGLLANIPKWGLGRARPGLGEPTLFIGPNKDFHTQSFPSGHTTHAVAFSGTLLLLAPEIGVPALAFPAITAWGRLAIHAHYPSDIAGGATLGALGAMIAAETTRRRARGAAGDRKNS